MYFFTEARFSGLPRYNPDLLSRLPRTMRGSFCNCGIFYNRFHAGCPPAARYNIPGLNTVPPRSARPAPVQMQPVRLLLPTHSAAIRRTVPQACLGFWRRRFAACCRTAVLRMPTRFAVRPRTAVLRLPARFAVRPRMPARPVLHLRTAAPRLQIRFAPYRRPLPGNRLRPAAALRMPPHRRRLCIAAPRRTALWMPFLPIRLRFVFRLQMPVPIRRPLPDFETRHCLPPVLQRRTRFLRISYRPAAYRRLGIYCRVPFQPQPD